jgi:hypothetical protein
VLEGIVSHSFNLDDNMFSLEYDSQLIDERSIIQSIEELRNFKVTNWIEL